MAAVRTNTFGIFGPSVPKREATAGRGFSFGRKTASVGRHAHAQPQPGREGRPPIVGDSHGHHRPAATTGDHDSAVQDTMCGVRRLRKLFLGIAEASSNLFRGADVLLHARASSVRCLRLLLQAGHGCELQAASWESFAVHLTVVYYVTGGIPEDHLLVSDASSGSAAVITTTMGAYEPLVATHGCHSVPADIAHRTRLPSAADVFHTHDFSIRVCACSKAASPGVQDRPRGWYRDAKYQRNHAGPVTVRVPVAESNPS